MKFSCSSNAVRIFIRCNAVFSRMKYPRRFGCCEKQSVRISINLKLLLSRKELERVFYMKKLCLVDIFPTIYHLNRFDNRFVKISQKTIAASRRPPHAFQNQLKTIRNIKTISTYESCALSIVFQRRITRLVLTNGSKTRAKTVPKITKISKNRIPRFSKFETALKP